jgi:ATP-dependent exoDNAse (exonuclease V) beta subunit
MQNIDLKEIYKTDAVIQRLNEIALKGFSPSSLTSYIRNPIDFYKKKILQLQEVDEMEEIIATNTFGTIIHETLKELYTPFTQSFITKKDILTMKDRLLDEVPKQFKSHYSLNSILSGKNYLTFEIANQFLKNFLNYEISELDKGKKIKILEIEKNVNIIHEIQGLSIPLKLTGQIDRIDEVDGIIRILDYKTGKVTESNLLIKEWDLLSTDYECSKSFQILMYAYMYLKDVNIHFKDQNIESGIISFKNLRSGFMKVNKREIDENTMEEFEAQLNKVILEIYNLDIPFTEKEIKKNTF